MTETVAAVKRLTAFSWQLMIPSTWYVLTRSGIPGMICDPSSKHVARLYMDGTTDTLCAAKIHTLCLYNVTGW